ncbi:MAG: hypothetical protein QOF77_162 [Solirubrobacteraceae bacterium]|jgi:hypothetical protein|nr:hypothetical protein [Solirubrobacteraceae bacterium]
MIMKRLLIALAVGASLLGLVGAAAAAITEIGMTTGTVTPPSCPGSPCLAVSQTTGYQAKIGTQKAPVSVTRAGRIVAWSITQGQPSPAQIKFFDAMEGGNSAAAIAVLRPGPKLNFTLVSQSPVMRLQPYFGKTVQFPLETTLAVSPGDVIALTVPTWTPALALGYGHDTSWRASRSRTGCANTGLPSAHTSVGSTVQYYCLYGTARLTYSATLISTP